MGRKKHAEHWSHATCNNKALAARRSKTSQTSKSHVVRHGLLCHLSGTVPLEGQVKPQHRIDEPRAFPSSSDPRQQNNRPKAYTRHSIAARKRPTWVPILDEVLKEASDEQMVGLIAIGDPKNPSWSKLTHLGLRLKPDLSLFLKALLLLRLQSAPLTSETTTRAKRIYGSLDAFARIGGENQKKIQASFTNAHLIFVPLHGVEADVQTTRQQQGPIHIPFDRNDLCLCYDAARQCGARMPHQ
ncbi:hypothetical protein KC360_g6872 [Hortaea werneckii]|nr:hypothetical protein KC325_g6884 [Hortaea werneckii]KAI7000484.1 hypothetical protein KC359_g1146 [Hortaea werneckii]KAI7142073.1 hypothetical protein KC344_g7507 [Hortaea werneckii]KAI7170388.1 hypothetical protein KC360_g6872 [Hortaea werneckii]